MLVFFFFKQKTAYEMRISDWSSDVCSSDLAAERRLRHTKFQRESGSRFRGRLIAHARTAHQASHELPLSGAGSARAAPAYASAARKLRGPSQDIRSQHPSASSGVLGA